MACLLCGEKKGHGNFGEVWKGLLDDRDHRSVPEYLVAAKTVLNSSKSQEAKEDLLQEATVMAQVGEHVNLVSLIGVITSGDPYVIIISYCEHSSAMSSLAKRAAAGQHWPTKDKLKMCFETACGMAFLVAQHFVHRDLAARNVLLATGNVCKVADFGLSRSVGRPPRGVATGAAANTNTLGVWTHAQRSHGRATGAVSQRRKAAGGAHACS